ncbi:Type IIS restriction enzyme Eco57I [Mariniflexile rhizosphaerae]|uniref:Eco57I restriction-modification methylase domain-containing protein n=1 Tax=unclassified Mariniflexile TaxID=2643887 RepID=UPI000CBB8229|nr:N-6 DNA methylase [Mariniflexile sp. TRM1-10]AXP81106.1 Type IIS restriction enzyme Eco57I [Mariniflexile sp. TRM1-10]PLB18717.1 MAG: N-6 DNA methylase [Flavobacteriaceae bacterium FS1-H7996/R]
MRNAFKYLSKYSTTPKDVDRLIISAFLEINKLELKKNKLLKSYSIGQTDKEEYISLIEFILVINSDSTKFGFEELIELFEFVISPADRIINGAIYTPEKIRDYIVKESFTKATSFKNHILISDIACGCGGFLFNASKELKKRTSKTYAEIFKNNIFGIDIQEYSINRTKLLLSLLALQSNEDEIKFEFNLFQGDSLDFDWTIKIAEFKGFNIILGNPPYVCARNLDKETKEKLKGWEVCKSGNSDLYIPFFQIAIENLSENGILGFITMNSFFKSLNGRALRGYFQRKQLAISIIDFGSEQIFKSKNTYTCICFIENRNQHFITYNTSESDKLKRKQSFKKVNYKNLDSRKGWNLKDNKTISKIESTGIPFGELHQTRHGIATLKNDIYIFKPVDEDENYFYLQNGSLYKIEKGICKDIVNSNKLSREISLNNLKEKVIFPYDQQEKPKILEEELIKENFPEAYKYFQNKRKMLSERDKGKGNYENWFAFGRTQSLEKIKNKMFFPKYSDRTPNFIINSDDDLLFYNGLAVVGSSEIEMKIIKKIMESNIFWYYIKTTSKPYSSNYYSLNGNYIRNFGVCELTQDENKFLIEETDQDILNEFFEYKYEVKVR